MWKKRRSDGSCEERPSGPLFNRLELPVKRETVTWSDYFLAFEELLQSAPKKLVFRGHIGDLIPGRAELAPDPWRRTGGAPGLEIDTDDVHCERTRRETAKAERAALRRMSGPGDETLNADDWSAARRRTAKRPLGYRDSVGGAPEDVEVADVTPRATARARVTGQEDASPRALEATDNRPSGSTVRSAPNRRAAKSTGGARRGETGPGPGRLRRKRKAARKHRHWRLDLPRPRVAHRTPERPCWLPCRISGSNRRRWRRE